MRASPAEQEAQLQDYGYAFFDGTDWIIYWSQRTMWRDASWVKYTGCYRIAGAQEQATGQACGWQQAWKRGILSSRGDRGADQRDLSRGRGDPGGNRG